jgi:hypothetical protein
MIYKMALDAYICLNLLYCFPGLWDSNHERETDYRSTGVYQYMLRSCTWTGVASDIPAHPHRRFFGIADKQFYVRHRIKDKLRWAAFTKDSDYGEKFPYGLMAIDELLRCEEEVDRRASLQEVHQVEWMLCQKSLPLELVKDIMDMAEYIPQRRLKVPHDPLHIENRDELTKYLTYCWILLVRCNMMALAVGIDIDWKREVTGSIIKLWGCECPRTWYDDDYRPDEPLDYGYKFI